MLLEKRTAVKPLGAHTALGHLHELNRWKDIPYLDRNDGMLPPFIIAVGSRVRVLRSPDILKLKDPIFIDQEALSKVGLEAYGRVAILIGMYETAGFAFPLAVVETQMGCSATQINLKELMYFARDDEYNINHRTVKSDSLYVIRAGTCAGVNSSSPAEVKTGIGDILIATESYGSIGALIQSTLSELGFTGINAADKVDALRRLLSEHRVLRLSHDTKNMRTECSTRLILQLQRAADKRDLRNLVGPNFTKDSLYAEMGEDDFAALRDTYGVISTEMEEPVIDVLAAEFRKAGMQAHTGLISAAIGAIPGKSFAETPAEKKAAADAEENILRIAADAFGNIARALNQ